MLIMYASSISPYIATPGLHLINQCKRSLEISLSTFAGFELARHRFHSMPSYFSFPRSSPLTRSQYFQPSQATCATYTRLCGSSNLSENHPSPVPLLLGHQHIDHRRRNRHDYHSHHRQHTDARQPLVQLCILPATLAPL